MSTVGKVLTVLVMLVAVAWVMLSATVAQLNRNGTQAVEALQKQVAKLETDVRGTERSFRELKDRTSMQQAETQKTLTVFQVRLSDVEKARSEQQETATRVTIQVADIEANVKAATALREERLAEKKAEIKGKADAESSVERLKAENTKMVARLTSLRTKFKTTLAENKALVNRLLKSGSKPKPKAASLSR